MHESNKRIVHDFYEMAFNRHKPWEAAKHFFGNRYIQHNPHVQNGAEAFYTYFEAFFKEHPHYHAEIKRIISQGDLVALHLHSRIEDQDRGRAIVDIFRLEKGKIVEHWDVIQDVPEKPVNENTMF